MLEPLGHTHASISRRTFSASLAMLGASALTGPARSAAQTGKLIDVHHHFYPPPYLKASDNWDMAHGRAVRRQNTWSPAQSLEEMDRNNVATSIVSLSSTPGPWWGVDKPGWAGLSRACNEFGAGMIRDNPGRFGLFASLPMPDVDASLKEIEYAFDTLKAEGIGLQTDFGDTWPGDKAYLPAWEELNRRKAVVYFHPLAPNCCMNLVAGAGDGNLEYPTDTGRAALSLLLNGVFATFRDIKFVFSHAGGPIPMLAGRWETGNRDPKLLARIAPNGLVAELKRQYYEIANSAFRPTLAALFDFAPIDHIMFGSDFPYYSTGENAQGLAAYGPPAADLAAIQRGNALRLFPGLKA
jgi:predicted TIM-barrel fold metal-dependent hydrolase